MTDSDKELALEVEYLRADLELLRQEVDSMNLYMKAQKVSVDTMVMTLRDMLRKNS